MNKRTWEGKVIRNMYADSFLEIFMVTAVTTVLAIRFFLGLTGYPQLSGGGLHIAHVLVGGVAMLISILILLTFLDNYSRNLAAVLGGIGFGAFIDELGKFITSDNNYFFQPTIGLIYIIFVLIFILIKEISRRKSLTEKERQINILEISKEAVIRGNEDYGMQMARSILEKISSQGTFLKDPSKTAGFMDEMHDMPPLLNPESKTYAAFKTRAEKIYLWMIERKWFVQLLIAFFFLKAVFSLIGVIYITVGIHSAFFWLLFFLISLGVYRALISGISTIKKIFYILILIVLTLIFIFAILNLTLPSFNLANWLYMGFAALAGGLSVAGILIIRKDRLRAYHLFENSILIYIFFVHIFEFFDIELYGIFSLFIDIITLMGLRYMINQEEKTSNVPKLL